MKNWFLSLHGAITLSLIALLTFVGRLFLDWRYESSLMGAAGSTTETINILLQLAFIGGWVLAMLAATRGSSRGLIASLIFALFLDLGFVFAMFFFWCPPVSCRGFPTNSGLWRWTWMQLVFGLAAAIALIMQIRQK